MKRPIVRVTLRDASGTVLHTETRQAFNAGIRASEAAVREIARARTVTHVGRKPSRNGDVYTRAWVSANGHLVVATVEKFESPDA